MANLNPKFYEGLFYLTDKMGTALKDDRRLTLGDIDALLGEACGALTKALDRGLEEVFYTAANLTKDESVRADMRAIVRDAQAFTEFIAFERHTLIACGVSEGAAGYVVAQLAKTRELLTAFELSQSDTMVKDVIASVLRCRDDICIASQQAGDTLKERQKRHWMNVGTLVIFGLSIGIANAAATMITAGAATPFVALSGVSGTAMITASGIFRTAPRDSKPGEPK